MNFHPKPANDFQQFYETYYQRCCARCPKIRAVAAKWTFEDLIPGLSDFDTRFITADDMTVDDWASMSIEVGDVHTQMCREFPDWARNLEHLPGINLTESEFCNPLMFYPEFQQWTFYGGDKLVLERLDDVLAKRSWGLRDERYHLKKYATFCGPYQRGIDPPVNLGVFENKYALHSRFMHYFSPPVQAAVSLVQKRNVRGKLDALRMARDLFPNGEVIDMTLEAVDHHYELPGWYQEPKLTEIERQLEAYLDELWVLLGDHVTLVQPQAGDKRPIICDKVGLIEADPVASFFEGAKFCRLMKGRLLFYADSIDWFDSTWLIENELGRITSNFYEAPLKLYGQLRFGEMLKAHQVLERLEGELLTVEECAGVKRFAEVAGKLFSSADARNQASRVAEHYSPMLEVLEKLADHLLELINHTDVR